MLRKLHSPFLTRLRTKQFCQSELTGMLLEQNFTNKKNIPRESHSLVLTQFRKSTFVYPSYLGYFWDRVSGEQHASNIEFPCLNAIKQQTVLSIRATMACATGFLPKHNASKIAFPLSQLN